MIWFYLLSGLFLGWSLGANDAANIFGTAVATRMVKFRVAALIAAVFVVLGAVISGAGATETLGHLGAVNAVAGSFTVALAAGLAVTWMTRLGMTVSTTQAIVGAIVGWNLFSGTPTNLNSLTTIVASWVVSPILAGAIAAVLYFLTRMFLSKVNIHLLREDAYNRLALIVIGAFGAYSLGANNIANVMGVFVSATPFNSLHFGNLLVISGKQQLFLFGALAIGVGIYTYSHGVIKTVGNDLFKLTPITAFIVVFSESLVLFLFASRALHFWLLNHGLPAPPLIPLSSSQAVVGAILGLAVAKGARGIRFRVLGRIAASWVTVPIIAGVLSLLLLFFMKNLFEQEVVAATRYRLSEQVLTHLRREGLPVADLQSLNGESFSHPRELQQALRSTGKFGEMQMLEIFNAARVDSLQVDTARVDVTRLTESRYRALAQLQGHRYSYRWQLGAALARLTPAWDPGKADTPLDRQRRQELLSMVYRASQVPPGKREGTSSRGEAP